MWEWRLRTGWSWELVILLWRLRLVRNGDGVEYELLVNVRNVDGEYVDGGVDRDKYNMNDCYGNGRSWMMIRKTILSWVWGEVSEGEIDSNTFIVKRQVQRRRERLYYSYCAIDVATYFSTSEAADSDSRPNINLNPAWQPDLLPSRADNIQKLTLWPLFDSSLQAASINTIITTFIV